MQPIDFRYRLSDQGRIVLGPLSSEETVEFELLSRRDREGLMDLPSELRLLELYVKYVGFCDEAPLACAQAPLAPSEPSLSPPRRHRQPLSRGSLMLNRPPEPARPRNYVLSMIVIASVSFTLIALLVG